MSSLQQQLLYTFVGTVKLSKDKFLELLEDLIQNQEYTEEEGRRLTMLFTEEVEIFKKDLQMSITQKYEDAKNSIKTPIQQKIDEITKDIQKKVHEFSIQQLLSHTTTTKE
ncbi:MAG TPA: hypothetical protein VFD65_05325 [Chitinophagales bacterium]|nr:hypothetical protein [Chitinophagales bacterium]